MKSFPAGSQRRVRRPTGKWVVWIWWTCWLGLLAASHRGAAAEPAELSADFAVSIGRIRPLHGINKGPRVPGGLIDLSSTHRALGIPSIRLHDCGWPNPPVVDIHAVFPNPNADPSQASSYDFRLTDDYLAAIQALGAQMVYRLGESIEHTSVRRYVHPPADPEKWAAICLGILRHYNAGWANGFRYGIKYWEIWNEPENRPAMWSGSDEDYFRLYEVAAKAIHREFPDVRVGGPSVGASGALKGGRLHPTAFVTNFLSHCRRTQSPLHFFSWHCYTDRPEELTGRAWEVRRLLDGAGFDATESHLNEWNFLPGNHWTPISAGATPAARKQHYETMSGAAGAAFLLASLLELQDAPIDQCQLFHGELGGFGLFDDNGVPRDNYHGLLAFRRLLDNPIRVATRGGSAGRLGFVAGKSEDGREVTLLAANYADAREDVVLRWRNVPWSGATRIEVQSLDATHEFRPTTPVPEAVGEARVRLALKAPAVVLVTLRPADAKPPLPF